MSDTENSLERDLPKDEALGARTPTEPRPTSSHGPPEEGYCECGEAFDNTLTCRRCRGERRLEAADWARDRLKEEGLW